MESSKTDARVGPKEKQETKALSFLFNFKRASEFLRVRFLGLEGSGRVVAYFEGVIDEALSFSFPFGPIRCSEGVPRATSWASFQSIYFR